MVLTFKVLDRVRQANLVTVVVATLTDPLCARYGARRYSLVARAAAGTGTASPAARARCHAERLVSLWEAEDLVA